MTTKTQSAPARPPVGSQVPLHLANLEALGRAARSYSTEPAPGINADGLRTGSQVGLLHANLEHQGRLYQLTEDTATKKWARSSGIDDAVNENPPLHVLNAEIRNSMLMYNAVSLPYGDL